MRLKSEAELLDPVVRKCIIDEIEGSENLARKHEAYKRYKCYKDDTKAFVIEQLLAQFDETTVKEMQYGISNISFVRKCIDKLARVYSNGASREVPGKEVETAAVSALSKKLCVDTELKKTNRFMKLQKNTALYIKPCPVIQSNGSEKWSLQILPLNPYLYDAIEDYYQRTKPMAYVLSHYEPKRMAYSSVDPAVVGRGSVKAIAPVAGDGKDQKIADTPEDMGAEKKEYIFWSASYHFTCGKEGEIISDQSKMGNPIQELPFVNFAIDQDGAFWATGGGDLIDGGILINAMLSNIHHIGVTQGYGQAWMKGKNLPRSVKVGPSKIVLMEYEEGEPEPQFGFASSSPQLDSLKGLVEMYVALLLTTNNLSTSGVASALSGNQSAASGVALMIDKAESREDVQDQEQLFRDKEPEMWGIILKWIGAYGDSLVDEMKVQGLPDAADIKVKFNPMTTIMTESEKLDAIAKRKELGLDSQIDSLMKDDPSLSREDAEKKFARILEDKMQAMASSMIVQEPETEEEPEQEAESKPEEV